MSTANALESLLELPVPILTVCSNTSEAGAAQEVPAFKPAYPTRLENQINAIAPKVRLHDQKSFQTQAERVQSYLLDHPMPYRETVVFAGARRLGIVAFASRDRG